MRHLSAGVLSCIALYKAKMVRTAISYIVLRISYVESRLDSATTYSRFNSFFTWSNEVVSASASFDFASRRAFKDS